MSLNNKLQQNKSQNLNLHSCNDVYSINLQQFIKAVKSIKNFINNLVNTIKTHYTYRCTYESLSLYHLKRNYTGFKTKC